MTKEKSISNKYYRFTQKYNRDSKLIVWGVIGFVGGLRLKRLTKILNRVKYKDLFEKNLVETGILEDKVF